MRKIPISITSVLAGIVLISYQCQQRCPGKDTIITPVSFSPEKDTIAIGDTIWITSDFADVFTGKDGDVWDFSAYTFANVIGFQRIELDSVISDTAMFTFVPVKGSFPMHYYSSEKSWYLHPEYEHTNGRYSIKIGMVARQAGVFKFGFGSSTLIGFDNRCETPEPCRCKTTMTNLFKVNEGREANIYLLDNLKDPDYIFESYRDKLIKYGGNYFLVVK